MLRNLKKSLNLNLTRKIASPFLAGQLQSQYQLPANLGAGSSSLLNVPKFQFTQQIYLMSANDNDFDDNNNISNNMNPPPDDNDDDDEYDSNDLLTDSQTAKLEAVPLKYYKASLTEEEKKIKPQTFIIFSSPQPILPHQKIPCQMRTGSLQEIQHPLSYFLINDIGNVYLVGIVLDKQVQRDLQKSFAKNSFEQANNYGGAVNLEISAKKMNYRVKIIEIEVRESGIFAKCIPYRDRKLTAADKSFNMEKQMEQIRSLVYSLKKSTAYEKVEAFSDIDLEKLNFRDFSLTQYDQAIYQIVAGIQKLYAKYLKENVNILIQNLIESRSVISRILLLKKNLESLEGVMEIVNRNFKQADENLVKMHAQARAKLSIEYIKSTYLNNMGFDDPKKGGGQGQGGQGGPFGPQPGGAMNPDQKNVKNFMEKLELIEDPICKDKVKKEIERFAQLDRHSSEYHKIYTYLDEVFSIPWAKFSSPFWDTKHAQEVLDKHIFGLQKVKERIIELIAINQLKKHSDKSKGFVLLLQGPPGTGKTSIAKAIAESLKRESRFISFAGVADPYFIKGHRRTYVDSQPGVFIKELIKSGKMNPVIILDEIDKIVRNTMGGDPYYSLLEILNPDENANFTDQYLDIKVDFSNTIFILTANDILHMLEPLKNRLEIIEIPAYIEEEKLKIGAQYLIPKALETHGMTNNLLKYNDKTLSQIIKHWCYNESGVRELKRSFEQISRKYAVEILQKYPELYQNYLAQKAMSEGNSTQDKNAQGVEASDDVVMLNTKKSDDYEDVEKKETQKEEELGNLLTLETIEKYGIQPLDLTDNKIEVLKKYLGNPVFDADSEERNQKVFPNGTCNILTVAGFVGFVMTLETCYDNSQPNSKGLVNITGNLKQVIKESVSIAKINVARLCTEEQIKLFSDRNIHIHFMSGGIPKDGPSAGIAICTALLSLIQNKPVPARLAMTGELSLNGEVHKIGGIQSKLIAAKTININTVLCPYSNMGDVLECSKLLLEGMTIYFCKEYTQIYEIIFEEKRNNALPAGVVVLKDGIITDNYLDLGYPQNISVVSNTVETAESASDSEIKKVE